MSKEDMTILVQAFLAADMLNVVMHGSKTLELYEGKGVIGALGKLNDVIIHNVGPRLSAFDDDSMIYEVNQLLLYSDLTTEEKVEQILN